MKLKLPVSRAIECPSSNGHARLAKIGLSSCPQEPAVSARNNKQRGISKLVHAAGVGQHLRHLGSQVPHVPLPAYY